MPSSFYPAQIEQLKRKAKRVARFLNVSHSKALDQVALEEGFDNWSLLMRHNQAPYHFERSESDWKAALLLIKGIDPYGANTHGLLLEPIHERFVSTYNASSFALEYMRSVLSRPRYLIRRGSLAYAEMRWWLPYSVHDIDDDSVVRLLVNRHYKPVGYVANEHVDYSRFESLHERFGFDQLKAFSNEGRPTGYLFDDGNAPWISRADAVEYAKRLEQLCLAIVDGPPDEGLSTWTYTQNAIFEALAPWARIPTWYTPHPADEKRLLGVLEGLKRCVHGDVNAADVRAALRAHRKQNPEILGGKASDAMLERYVQRILELTTSL